MFTEGDKVIFDPLYKNACKYARKNVVYIVTYTETKWPKQYIRITTDKNVPNCVHFHKDELLYNSCNFRHCDINLYNELKGKIDMVEHNKTPKKYICLVDGQSQQKHFETEEQVSSYVEEQLTLKPTAKCFVYKLTKTASTKKPVVYWTFVE